MSSYLNNGGLANLLPLIVTKTRAEVQSGINVTVAYANNAYVHKTSVANIFNGNSNTELPTSNAINNYITNNVYGPLVNQITTITNTLNNAGEITGVEGQLYSWNVTNAAVAINVISALNESLSTSKVPVSSGGVVNVITNLTAGANGAVPMYNGFGSFAEYTVDSVVGALNVGNLVTSSAVFNIVNNAVGAITVLTNEQINTIVAAAWSGSGSYGV